MEDFYGESRKNSNGQSMMTICPVSNLFLSVQYHRKKSYLDLPVHRLFPKLVPWICAWFSKVNSVPIAGNELQRRAVSFFSLLMISYARISSPQQHARNNLDRVQAYHGVIIIVSWCVHNYTCYRYRSIASALRVSANSAYVTEARYTSLRSELINTAFTKQQYWDAA